MGTRAHVQVRHPEYGNCRLSSWVREKAYDYLTAEHGIDVYTDFYGVESDKWEIEIPSRTRIEEVIADLRANPTCLDEKEDIGRKHALDLADLLSEGLEAAEKNNYAYIIIEWF